MAVAVVAHAGSEQLARGHTKAVYARSESAAV